MFALECSRDVLAGDVLHVYRVRDVTRRQGCHAELCIGYH